MKKPLLCLLAIFAAVFACELAYAANSVGVCQTVTSATNVLTFNSSRVSWSVLTTSGAATVYFKMGAGATVGGTDSIPLQGGQTYTDDTFSYKGIVSVIPKTGSVWVCTKENSQ